MKKAGGAGAVFCICGTLFMGCYTSTLLEADDDWLGKIPSESIVWVATKAGVRYQFVAPPEVVQDTIVLRPAGERRDRIASTEVGYVITKEGEKYLNKPRFIEKEMIPSGNIEYAVMKDGTRYEFDEAPAIVNDTIVGVPVPGREQDSARQVFLPLVGVAEVYVSEFRPWRTAGAAILGLYLALGVAIECGKGKDHLMPWR
jgi:hypothetical protein